MTTITMIDTKTIRDLFTQEVVAHGGHVIQTSTNKQYLLIEATLTISDSLLKGDYVQGGVALYYSPELIAVHPYLFRLICESGLLIADTPEECIIWQQGDKALTEKKLTKHLNTAIKCCTKKDTFSQTIASLKTSLSKEVILLKEILSLPRFTEDNSLLNELLRHAIIEDDDTAFGLINTITSTARDITFPQTCYQLQKLAGEIVKNIYHNHPINLLNDSEDDDDRSILA